MPGGRFTPSPIQPEARPRPHTPSGAAEFARGSAKTTPTQSACETTNDRIGIDKKPTRERSLGNGRLKAPVRSERADDAIDLHAISLSEFIELDAHA
jgi:hypothetical protein